MANRFQFSLRLLLTVTLFAEMLGLVIHFRLETQELRQKNDRLTANSEELSAVVEALTTRNLKAILQSEDNVVFTDFSQSTTDQTTALIARFQVYKTIALGNGQSFFLESAFERASQRILERGKKTVK